MEEKEEILLIKDKNGKVKKRYTRMEILEKQNRFLKLMLFICLSTIALLVLVLITFITVNFFK